MRLIQQFAIVLLVLFTWNSKVLSQCADCVADLTCVGVDGLPAICPDVAEVAFTNAYYEQFLTFYVPTQVTDPGSGIDATILSIEVLSVSGMPFGLEFTLNDADGIFYPSQGENYGCATICGTPLIAGTYDVQIAVLVTAEAFGFELEQNETFPYTIIVEPGEGGTGSFSYDNSAGCGQLAVSYEALLSAPAPSVTTYEWDFGNGEISSEAMPSNVQYPGPGTYTCFLTTTISDFHLNSITVSALSDNWGGDIDDVFSTSDTYFSLSDGQGNVVFSSDVIDNNNTPSWSDLNILLSNPPYTVTFFDEDDISADDDLGTANISLTAGNNDFTLASGTVGQFNVSLDLTATATDNTEINVFEIPAATFWVNGNQLYFDDPNLTTYQWYVNGMLLADEINPTIDMVGGGEYTCWITNIYGCSAFSNSYLYCPDIVPTYSALAQEVSVDPGHISYSWFFNGVAIEGANNYYVSATELGNYSVLVTTSYGCTTLSDVYQLNIGVESIDAIDAKLSPNPAQDFTLIQGLNPGAIITITDIQGRIIRSIVARQSTQEIDIIDLAPGIYPIIVNNGNQQQHFKLVKQ
jgi:hypothetical protein